MPLQEASPIYSDLGSDADMAELVEEFVGALQQRAAAINQAVQTENLPEITRLAHQLKGAGGGYGFAVIGAAAAQLESAGKVAQSVAQVQSEVETLIDMCRRARAGAPTP